MREAEREQRRQFEQMQMEQMRGALDKQKRIEGLGSQFFGPVGPQPTNDDSGFPMPPVPQRFDAQGYTQALAGIDPMKAIGLQSQLAQIQAKQGPMRVGKDDRLVDPQTGRVMVDAAPAMPKAPEIGKVREIYKGGNVIQQEWTGEKWADVGKGPRFKPDAPERPAAPQLYEGPNGPMWITPPGRGTGPVPVSGPDGKPLGPKKGEKGLTETQAKATLYTGMMQDAENAIANLKFDPSTLKNQTDIALARGDLSYIPKSLQNVAASATAQQYAQGTFQWTEAMLRQLTGAAAPEPEVWRQVKTYWPQPGDSKAVVARKNAARQQVAEYVRIVAAGGADKADAATNVPKTNIEDLIKRYAH